MKRILSLMAASAIAVGGVVFYTNASPGKPGPHGRPAVIQRLINHLELSQEQVAKIKEELREEKETVAPLLKQLHESRKALRETIQSGADEKAIREAHSKVSNVEADLAVHRAKIRSKIVPHLSEEQVQKMQKLEARFDEMTERKLEHFGKRLDN